MRAANDSCFLLTYRYIAAAALAACLAVAPAQVKYTVEARPADGTVHVTMLIPGTGNGCSLQIPNWGPGGYSVRDGSTRIQHLAAADQDGKALKIDTKVEVFDKPYEDGGVMRVAHNRSITWIVAPARDTVVQYDVSTPVSDGSMHVRGPATYVYETSRLQKPCELELKVPNGWPVYTGLRETQPGSHKYKAKTYDVLADNPISMGDLTVDSYVSRGKTNWIVMYGPYRKNVDRPKLIKMCKFVSDMESDFFGDALPCEFYVWHFNVTPAADGGGGLEHLASTEITLAQGTGPRTMDVMAHEFFHQWNVKRIRSKVLGPFDYTKLPQTGAIWWLEGVTDYYAYTLLHRYGWHDDTYYFGNIASNITAVRRNAAYKLIGPDESSMRVDEASGGHGNSNGLLISYYNLGWLAGMCLDIELRSATGGKHTLDDVEHALWNMCKDDKPGFEEDAIRNIYLKLGGQALDVVYNRIVFWPDGMRLEQTLAKAGLELVETPEAYTELGFTFGGGFGGGGFGGGGGAPGLRVTAVTPAAAGKLEVGDSIVAVNGVEVGAAGGGFGGGARGGGRRGGGAAGGLRTAPAGKAIALTIERGGKTMEVSVTPFSSTRPTLSVRRLANPTPEQKALGDGWLAKMAFKP